MRRWIAVLAVGAALPSPVDCQAQVVDLIVGTNVSYNSCVGVPGEVADYPYSNTLYQVAQDDFFGTGYTWESGDYVLVDGVKYLLASVTHQPDHCAYYVYLSSAKPAYVHGASWSLWKVGTEPGGGGDGGGDGGGEGGGTTIDTTAITERLDVLVWLGTGGVLGVGILWGVSLWALVVWCRSMRDFV